MTISSLTIYIRMLGDLNVKSWINCGNGDDADEDARVLDVEVIGFSCGVYSNREMSWDALSILSNVDVTVKVTKTMSLVTSMCQISDVFINLSYTDFVAFVLVVNENLCKKVDKSNWDNLEVAWEKELSSAMTGALDLQAFSKDVSYSSSARYVRFGREKKSDSKLVIQRQDYQVRLDVVSVILRCNDPVDDENPESEYDMVLFRGQGFDAAFKRDASGQQSLGLTLQRIFLFDLGERDHAFRRIEEDGDAERTHSSFAILVDGYSPSEDTENATTTTEQFDSQLVLNFDRAHGQDAKLSILINYISVTFLVRPFVDIVAFITRSWPHDLQQSTVGAESDSLDGHVGESLEEARDAIRSEDTSFHFKFVLHYPRLIFVANETDPHSQGLVLRG